MTVRAPLRTAEDVRRWSVVDENGCWIWQRSTNKYGYGLARNPAKQRNDKAHRVAYELFVGPIPGGLVIDHLCRNRACVNPDHLEPVTNRENLRRGVSFSAVNARKTHCIHGHEFTPDNTWFDSEGYRRCLSCYPRVSSHLLSTHCRNGHERSAATTYVRPSGGKRECLLCRRSRRSGLPTGDTPPTHRNERRTG